MASIEELRDVKQTEMVINLQAAVRRYLAKMDMKRRLERIDAYYTIQKNIRAWCVLRTWVGIISFYSFLKCPTMVKVSNNDKKK